MGIERGAVGAVAAAVLALSACAADEPDEPAPPTGPPAVEERTEPEEPVETDDPDDAATARELPGEETELGPQARDELTVLGVAHDDVLHVREAPGADAEAVGELHPVEGGFVATGRNRALDDGSLWAEIDVEIRELAGWVSTDYVGYRGDGVDLADDLDPDLVGETVWQLAEQIVADRFGTADREEELTMVLTSDNRHIPEAGEVTIDVLGFMDDALRGERLTIYARGGEGGYTVGRILAAPLCWRGVTDGVCL